MYGQFSSKYDSLIFLVNSQGKTFVEKEALSKVQNE